MLLALFPALPPAQEGDDASLRAIQEEIERLRGELARFDDREAGIVATLERLSLERLLLEEQVRALELERVATERRVGEARVRADRLEARMRQERVYLAAALRQAYKLGRLREFRLLLQVRSPEDLARAHRYIAAWTRADADRLDRFRRTSAALEAEEASLARRLEELARIRQEGDERREELEHNRVAQERALQRLEREREAGREAVVELEESAARLEALIASFPDGTQRRIDGRWIDLYTLRGHLPWPAKGEVVVPYGDIRHPRFQTVIPHPGIDVALPEGTPVFPIFGGRVVYADWFRGYGNTVIVDHGGATLSVYAHLRVPAVAVGDWVDPETTLGPSGATGSLRGPTLYLEIRHRGETEDPLDWLRPVP
jgi:septal ring factor EnvC (AmiA/AmiB activator)